MCAYTHTTLNKIFFFNMLILNPDFISKLAFWIKPNALVKAFTTISCTLLCQLLSFHPLSLSPPAFSYQHSKIFKPLKKINKISHKFISPFQKQGNSNL